MNNFVLHENKIRKNINPEKLLRNAKQEFPWQSLEIFSGKYYNMENKILDIQFWPVCVNQARPNYSVGSDQDEPEIQHDRWTKDYFKFFGIIAQIKYRKITLGKFLKKYSFKLNGKFWPNCGPKLCKPISQDWL